MLSYYQTIDSSQGMKSLPGSKHARRSAPPAQKRPFPNAPAAARAPIERTQLSEMVASRIRDHIIEHSLGEGDRLPTEHELADQFGVSRGSIREATKALGFLGIIRSAPRRGLTVGMWT